MWERDYAWLSIEIIMDEDIVYQISEDILQVIFDNLILNSVQQNENTQKLMITISINETNGFLNIKYCDNGKGLNDKYKTDPMKILEVHETTRTNGHGLLLSCFHVPDKYNPELLKLQRTYHSTEYGFQHPFSSGIQAMAYRYR